MARAGRAEHHASSLPVRRMDVFVSPAVQLTTRTPDALLRALRRLGTTKTGWRRMHPLAAQRDSPVTSANAASCAAAAAGAPPAFTSTATAMFFVGRMNTVA